MYDTTKNSQFVFGQRKREKVFNVIDQIFLLLLFVFYLL